MSENMEEFDDDNWTPPTPEEMKAIEARRQRMDKVSQQIGMKLLQGWALLDIECPSRDCHTPLMRDPQKRMFCLNCNLQVVEPHEYDPAKHTAVGNNESAPPQKETAPPSPSVAPAKVETSDDVSQKEVEKPQAKLEPTHAASVSKPTASSSNESGPTQATEVKESHKKALSSSPVVQQTIVALEEQLVDMAKHLKRQNKSLDDVIKICDAIRACASALEATHRASCFYDSTQ